MYFSKLLFYFVVLESSLGMTIIIAAASVGVNVEMVDVSDSSLVTVMMEELGHVVVGTLSCVLAVGLNVVA